MLTYNGMWGRGGAVVRALAFYTDAPCSIPGKGKNQAIGRSPVDPAVKWVPGPLELGNVKVAGHGAGHIIPLYAEAAESWHALTVSDPMSLNDSGRTFYLFYQWYVLVNEYFVSWKLVYSIVDAQYSYELNDSGHWKIWTQSVNDLGYFSVIYCARNRSHVGVSIL